MNKKDALEVIDKGWIRKPEGFRVRFQKKEDGEWREGYAPDGEKDFYDSDVVAWRIAWKLSRAALSSSSDPDMVNIYVVDDTGNPVPYYATGDYHIFCPS